MAPAAKHTAQHEVRAEISLASILMSGNSSEPVSASAGVKKIGSQSQGSGAKTFQPHHSQSVPKPENLVGRGSERNSKGVPITTMMLRNIPNKYTQGKLMQELDECGFDGAYDFFYLPMDVHNRSNVGYAFINFKEPEVAEEFRRLFSQHCFQRFHSRKVGTVCVAHVQGLDQNLRHFENRAVTHAKNDQYRPIVLQGRKRVDFEDALASAKARLGEENGGQPLPERARERDLEALAGAKAHLREESAGDSSSIGGEPEAEADPNAVFVMEAPKPSNVPLPRRASLALPRTSAAPTWPAAAASAVLSRHAALLPTPLNSAAAAMTLAAEPASASHVVPSAAPPAVSSSASASSPLPPPAVAALAAAPAACEPLCGGEGDDGAVAEARVGLETAIRDLLSSYSYSERSSSSTAAAAATAAVCDRDGAVSRKTSRSSTRSGAADVEQLLALRGQLVDRLHDRSEAGSDPEEATAPAAPGSEPCKVGAKESTIPVRLDLPPMPPPGLGSHLMLPNRFSSGVADRPAYVELPSKSKLGAPAMQLGAFETFDDAQCSTPRTNDLILRMSLDALRVDVDGDVWPTL